MKLKVKKVMDKGTCVECEQSFGDGAQITIVAEGEVIEAPKGWACAA